jgi:hypothetical protein
VSVCRTRHGPGLAAALLLLTTPAAADRARGIAIGSEEVLAMRGGVLLAPLIARENGDRWPQALPITLDDGRRLDGRVIWISRQAPVPPRRWTEDPTWRSVRGIRDSDDTAAPAPGGSPFVAARLPHDGHGPLRLDRQVVVATWLDRPAGATGGAEPLPAASAHDRPDADSAFEHWRCILLAQRLGMAPPDTSRFDGAAALVAEHVADLWALGMDRLRRADAEVAERCLDLLTCTTRDRGEPIAAWVADPDQTTALLALLLEPRTAPAALQARVRAWLDAQPPVLMWLESAGMDEVVLAVINRGPRAEVARFLWNAPGDIRAAAELEPGVLSRVYVDRPRPAGERRGGGALGDRAAPAVDVLGIEVRGRRYNLPVGPRVEEARPPGAMRQALRGPLTLAEVHGVATPAPPAAPMTLIELRRRDDRWELFLDCRRPAPGAADPEGLPAPLTGGAGVSVFIGDEDEDEADGRSSAELFIPEQGDWRLRRGRDPGTIEVHRKSYEDRWLCRVVLPDEWLREERGEPVPIGCLRVLEAGGGVQTAPGVSTPWRPVVGRLAVDLTAWSEIGR